jgi:putative PEP-CTERM system histidine kinase
MNNYVGIVSYSAAAAAFAFLTLLLIVSWRGRLPGLLLAIAALVSGLWAGANAYQYAHDGAGWRWAAVLEVVRSFAWYCFLVGLLTAGRDALASPRKLRWLAGAMAASALTLVIVMGALPESAFRPRYSLALSVAHLGMAIFGLVLIEYIYRNSHAEQRWGIKYLVLGLAAAFAYDFYLYSDAMLFKQVDHDVWAVRGVANALIVPLIAVAAARNPTWSLDVNVSRQVLFHSTTLVGAGLYLLVMAAAGYYLRVFGGSWGRAIQATFFFAGLVVLVALLTSGSLRSKLKIFLARNFFTYAYDYREEWLKLTQTLSGGEPGMYLRERAIQAVAELVESPGGALYIEHDAREFRFVSHWNMSSAGGSEPSDTPFIQLLRQRQWVINLQDATPGQGALPSGVTAPTWLHAIPQAAMVVPLILHERLLGFIVLARSRAELVFNWEVSDLLKTAGRQVASYVAHTEAAQALTVARQFESFTRTTTFVVHDLKNLVAQLKLLLDNAERHKRNPAFVDDMLETVANSVRKMQGLLTQLRSGSPAAENVLPLDVRDVLRRIAARYQQMQPAPQLTLTDVPVSVRADGERLERVLGHLVQNAIEATPPEGSVHASVALRDDAAWIEVADTGKGMSAEFLRNQLFQPFETTKPAGMGVGAYEAREYIQELGGTIEVESHLGRGTKISILLPLMSTQPVAAHDRSVELQ